MTVETGAGPIGASVYHNALDTKLVGTPLVSQGVTIAQLSDT
ncbi:hypothetical protein ACFQX4_06260 [Roseomonas sp. GCM10028921]